MKIKQTPVMFYAFGERAQRFQIFQIAYVMADESVIVARQTKGIFQLSAAGQNLLFETESGFDGSRRESARTPQNHFATGENTRHRIIRAHVYAAVVQQVKIRDAA